jgi:hypothetical protein
MLMIRCNCSLKLMKVEEARVFNSGGMLDGRISECVGPSYESQSV